MKLDASENISKKPNYASFCISAAILVTFSIV